MRAAELLQELQAKYATSNSDAKGLVDEIREKGTFLHCPYAIESIDFAVQTQINALPVLESAVGLVAQSLDHILDTSHHATEIVIGNLNRLLESLSAVYDGDTSLKTEWEVLSAPVREEMRDLTEELGQISAERALIKMYAQARTTSF